MAVRDHGGARRRPRPKRPAFTLEGGLWHNAAFRSILWQVLLVAAVLGVVATMAANAQEALAKRGVATGFGFLWREAGFPIGEGLLPFRSTDSYLRAFAAAITNTLTVSIASIIAATLLGVLLGFGRLSSNWFLARFSALYVELFRNTPQLVQLSFWYLLMTQAPGPRQAWNFQDAIFFCNRGLIFPAPLAHPAYAWMIAGLELGCAVAYGLHRWAAAYRDRTGNAVRIMMPCIAVIAGLPLAVWLVAGRPWGWSVPSMGGFNFEGGSAISPEFLVLFLGLSLYIAAFIAEIVRSGIQSVGRGQIEAAKSIGLKPGRIQRRIVLPQALRVMIPPAASQYVSLTKNSSLGVAIGYPELFSVTNSAITLSGQTIECMALMAACYLLVAVSISGLMNRANSLVQIKER